MRDNIINFWIIFLFFVKEICEISLRKIYYNNYILHEYIIKKFKIKNYFAYNKERFTNYIKFTIVIFLLNKKKYTLLTVLFA